jgi:hypothetical protein
MRVSTSFLKPKFGHFRPGFPMGAARSFQRSEHEMPFGFPLAAVMGVFAPWATWQPIDTAPKGDNVLLSDGATVGEGFWHDGSQCHGHRGGPGWFWESDRGDLLIASNAHATHWMPLPGPPEPPRPAP